ncbi:MAG: hypothetical protein GDA52_01215 [Rhodobacteraceae bacterium]|nr:hypothetical protein [Paracoccaceae bacterium]
MSKIIKALLAVGLFTSLAACANDPMMEEVVMVDPAPIAEEPVYDKN